MQIQTHVQLPSKYVQYSLEEYAKYLVDFLEQYSWLYRPHIVDFFLDSTWEASVPEEWREPLQELDLNELLVLPTLDKPLEKYLPASLLEFIRDANQIVLPRQLDNTISNKQLSKYITCTQKPVPVDDTLIGKELVKGMNSKKKHEVDILANLISHVCEEQNTTRVVDIGAGQGYLAHILACNYNLNVYVIDSNTSQIQNSQARTQRLSKFSTESMLLFSTLTIEINLSSINAHLKCDLTLEELEDILGEEKSEQGVTLVGNHTCGDLAPTMIRLFHHFLESSNNQNVTMINVGCCYHLLTEEKKSTAGFPLSSILCNTSIFLNKRGRMLACQAVDRWRDNVDDNQMFTSQYYRALLQVVLKTKFPELITDDYEYDLRSWLTSREFAVGKIRNNKKKNFGTYAAFALKRFVTRVSKTVQVEHDYTEESLQSFYDEFEQKNQGLAKVSAFWSLRTVLAPVIESLLLIDRLLYLKELVEKSTIQQGSVELSLFPLFDSVISPRNFVIVSRYKSTN